MKPGEIAGQRLLLLPLQRRAAGVVLRPFDHPDGKDHAGRFAALFTVGLRQQFQDIHQGRLFRPFYVWFDVCAVFPGAVDLALQPGDDFFRLFLVLKGIDRNFAGMNGDQFTGTLQGQSRRIFNVAEAAEHRVQIGQNCPDIIVEMGETVQGLGFRIAFRSENLQGSR